MNQKPGKAHQQRMMTAIVGSYPRSAFLFVASGVAEAVEVNPHDQ